MKLDIITYTIPVYPRIRTTFLTLILDRNFVHTFVRSSVGLGNGFRDSRRSTNTSISAFFAIVVPKIPRFIPSLRQNIKHIANTKLKREVIQKRIIIRSEFRFELSNNKHTEKERKSHHLKPGKVRS